MGRRTNTAVWIPGQNRWRINVQKDGKRRSFYSSTPGKKGQREANSKADLWLDDGVSAGSEKISIIYSQWLENELKLTTSSSNWRPLDSRWRTWVAPVMGNKKIANLTDDLLQQIINNAFAAGKSKKTLSSICTDLRAFCKYCRRRKLTNFLPEDLKIPAGARYKEKQILQPKDLLTLFNTDTTTYRGKTVEDEYINAYRFQVLTGLRPGELIGLRWEDVDGNKVHVRRAVNIAGEVTQGKNQNAVRSFILSEMARRVLENQREQTAGQESVFGITQEKSYYLRWKAHCAANGLTPCTLYELRHTFVSVVKTLPAGEVKGLVGHSRNMDTFGVYSHALTGDAEHLAQDVNDAFLNSLKNA